MRLVFSRCLRLFGWEETGGDYVGAADMDVQALNDGFLTVPESHARSPKFPALCLFHFKTMPKTNVYKNDYVHPLPQLH